MISHGQSHQDTLTYPVIRKHGKPASSLDSAMPDYERARAEFRWEDMDRALGLPRANGVNKASICIDDHPPEVLQRDALLWEGTDGRRERYTFADLKAATNRFA